MPSSTAGNLVSLFRSAAKLTLIRSSSTAAAASKKKKPPSPSSSSITKEKNKKKISPSSSNADDEALKKYVSSISYSESAKRLLKSYKAPPSSNSSLNFIVKDSLNPSYSCRIADDESAELLSTDASNLLYNKFDLDWDDENEDEEPVGEHIDLPCFSNASNDHISTMRKDFTRERKHKWVFKNTQDTRFDRLAKMCATKLGPNRMIEVFGKLDQQTGPKEYSSLIKICIEKARVATNEDASIEEIYKAFHLFKLVRENGFKIDEEIYGDLLLYLIDFGLIKEFFFFYELIRDENPDSLPRLTYYEMLLWVRVNDEVKIRELCHSAVADGADEKSYLREQLLLALCECDRKEEFVMLLETLDVTKVTSVTYLMRVFRSLGKLLLEPFAERFLLELETSDTGPDNISNFICEYAISIPNLAVEDIIIKFKALHIKMELLPTSTQYQRLIKYSCEFLKVHEALNLVDEAFGSGVSLSSETFHSILIACDRSCEYNLVHQIKSMICQYNLKPNNDTLRMMIVLFVKMKDFEGAYGIISDMEQMELKPTSSMYNIILSGYLREKNFHSARNVVKQMEDANVKPDALTFSYLISNSHREKDVIKFYDAMCNSGVQPTKHVFMALINAYAACGQFEKAKQIVSDARIPVQNLNEIKNVLVGALASNGQLPGALEMYEEMNEADCNLNPKAIKSLIEHFQTEGDLNKSLQLLKELNDSPYWIDACFKVISHCVQQEDLRCTIDLLKQLKDKFSDAELAAEVLFDEVFCLLAEKETTNMQFCLNLLQAIKEELGVLPSRKSLDFLLSACASAKDSNASFVIWKEYETAGLPYNVLSFVRMYQALLASGNQKSAAKILKKIPKDDPHVRCVITACNKTYAESASLGTKGKKKHVQLAATLGLLDELEAKSGH